MNFFQRRKILKKANLLELHPLRIISRWEKKGDKLILFVPKFKNHWLRSFLIPSWRSAEFRIKLDELGSAMWIEIDGSKTVGQICMVLSEIHGDKIQPVEERVAKFLLKLYQERYITFKEITKS